jgi:hypothetical protein
MALVKKTAVQATSNSTDGETSAVAAREAEAQRKKARSHLTTAHARLEARMDSLSPFL